ncbi:hypothetical protein J31TS4_30890 [Paenibacillus sp. J31TS4]|uniref:sugar phosphate isomerase/epimerase family protein n=1 Tax=Paenibacillus sp. J31TS4 TaxID=2807195 RepID=UPI001B1699B5|nr:sugar phosphate isomerase/epimerase family protein [Paenibacillus sp. J31TS4]GIP39809.1 hypothetical protein J31TS4_30890 [Paenibacillus sp. J31TS4]
MRRLGVLTDEVSPKLVEALEWIEQQGFEHVEIRMVDGKNIMTVTDEEATLIKESVAGRGLYVSAIASPVFKCALDPKRAVASGDTFGQDEESVEAHFAKLQRAFEVAQLLGTNKIRIFSFWREQQPELYEEEIVGHLKRAAELAEKAGILLLLENEPACNGGFAAEVGRLARLVDSPALKVLWDPGNEEYGGCPSFPDGYEQVKDVLGHVHLKDAYLTEEGTPRCVPIGMGNVPFEAQLRALERDGYDGLFTIETHYIPEGGTAMEGTALTLRGWKNIVTEVGTA